MAIDKFEGMKKMAQGIDKSELPTLVVNYDKPGKMIFAQGSELLHHVTPVLTDHTRYDIIFATHLFLNLFHLCIKSMYK